MTRMCSPVSTLCASVCLVSAPIHSAVLRMDHSVEVTGVRTRVLSGVLPVVYLLCCLRVHGLE